MDLSNIDIALTVKWCLFSLLVTVALGSVLVYVYHDNRRLFWCLMGVFIAHMVVGGTLWGIGVYLKAHPPEIRIKIKTIEETPPPPKEEKQPPKVEKPINSLAPPKGSKSGEIDQKQMPKGTSVDAAKAVRTAGHVLTGHKRGATPIPDNPDGSFSWSIGGAMRKEWLDGKLFGKDEKPGTPEGEGDGPVPYGVADGKIGGRVYFMRLKTETGPWSANPNGTRNLMGFLNKFLKCETSDRAYTATELRDKFLKYNVAPSFLYIVVDDSFSLSSTEVNILNSYIGKGGFLFIDSRPDPFIRAAVAKQLSRVIPGERLSPIAPGNIINHALFDLPIPGYGENWIEHKNYGVNHDGRLVVFYGPGNFAHFFDANPPGNSDPYFAAQYQQAVNVMIYAIMRGNVGGTRIAGAKATVTAHTMAALEKVFGAGFATSGGTGSKIIRGGKDDPTDVNLND